MLKSRKSKIISLIILVILVIFIIRILTGSSEKPINKEGRTKEVEVSSVLDLTKENIPLPAIGRVEALSEGDLRAEIQGEVVGVYRNLGDSVEAGTIIAEIENGAQRANVLQAEGVVDAATANLTKIRKGARNETRDILEIKKKSAEDLLVESKIAGINAFRNAYSTADDAVRNKIDQFFADPTTSNPILIFDTPESSQLTIDLNWGRFLVEETLNEWESEVENLDPVSDIKISLDKGEKRLNDIRAFLDKTASAVNSLRSNTALAQTTIDTWQGNVLSARTNINTALTTLVTAKNSLIGAEANVNVAQKETEQGSIGQEEDVLSAEASLKQAQAGLRAARAGLEKTFIRTPISGTINSLNVKKGSFVSLFEPVATVSNNNALEITTFISEKDLSEISEGNRVVIAEEWEAVVTKIAPAINPKTKKVEVKVGITDKKASLSNGQSVSLYIERVLNKSGLERLSIPVSSLKIKSGGIYVMVVNEKNELEEIKIEIGPIIGEKIIVENGLDPDTKIVVDARGLKTGETVLVK